MQAVIRPSPLHGSVAVPGSKSHTIRGVLVAALADGESRLLAPLESADTLAAKAVFGRLGASFEQRRDEWLVRGCGGRFQAPAEPLDVCNSGTTLRVALGACSLLRDGEARLTGDEQIRRRPCGPLVAALNALGADVHSEAGNGCAPFRVRGRLRGGRTSLAAQTSQYLTSLLLACPLAEGATDLTVPVLYEKPYVRMTLDWLAAQGVRIEHEDLAEFHIPGGQALAPFSRRIPADFSTASFFLVAGALPGNDITCRGLDMSDSQSDRAVIGFLRDMGADISVSGDTVRVRGGELRGIDMDLNDCPDSLPIMAVAGCFAGGTTRLLNAPHARIKETDRIAVMHRELVRLGARVTELADGLEITGSPLHGGCVDGCGDHRVVMALAVAATGTAGETRIRTAEAAAVTVPQFWSLVRGLGAAATEEQD